MDYRCGPEALEDAEIIVVREERRHRGSGATTSRCMARPGATVISFQNGVSNVEVLEQNLGGRFEVARGMVPYNVAYLGDGRFHKGVAGRSLRRAAC